MANQSQLQSREQRHALFVALAGHPLPIDCGPE
jgi:hypothetical protein